MPGTPHEEVRKFIVDNVYNGRAADDLKNDTSLIRSRLIDSIIALKMVSHLENIFNVEFEAQDVTEENLDTIDRIAAFVNSKLN